jgi:hypothetical protein
MKQQFRKSAKALVLLVAFTGCLMIVYSCTSYFGENDTMLDEQVPNLSRPRLEMNNLSSAEKVLSAKLLADPDFLQMVRLSTAHRNQRFARISIGQPHQK